jgi:hypothetical protein
MVRLLKSSLIPQGMGPSFCPLEMRHFFIFLDTVPYPLYFLEKIRNNQNPNPEAGWAPGI